MKKLLLSLALFIIHYSLFIPAAHASSEFATSFVSTYRIRENSTTEVKHKITIQNKLAHIYTKAYTLTLGSNSLSKLQITSNGQVAPYQRDDAGNITTITVSIPNPAIGLDQTLELDVSYDTSDLVEHYGNVWEVNIPKLLKANEADTYTREITVPHSFGQPTVKYPAPTSTKSDEEGSTIFSYHGYPSASITLLFGNHVDYKLDLSYDINNPTVAAADTEIALPPDTEYQKILIDQIEPAPKELRVDSDGNWLAIYPLRSQETKRIKAVLYASVYPYPYYANSSTPSPSLTKEAKYWEVKADNVKSLADKLKAPDNIYTYLVENFSYDYQRASRDSERVGASQALKEPNSTICTEFTDSFVALARAAGIPAREINGYARTVDALKRPTGSVDTLHAWPEYYSSDTKSWVQVDPTWGNTTGGVDYYHKLDFGHITFVRHGAESTYPYPAGSYKTNSADKSLSVTIASILPPDSYNNSVKEVEGGYLLKNLGNVALVDYDLKLPNGSSEKIKYLPPFAQLKLNKEATAPSFWQKLLTLICDRLGVCAH